MNNLTNTHHKFPSSKQAVQVPLQNGRRRLGGLPPGGFLNSFAFCGFVQEPFVDSHQPDYFAFELLIGNAQLGDLPLKPRLSLVTLDDFPSQVSDRLLSPV